MWPDWTEDFDDELVLDEGQRERYVPDEDAATPGGARTYARVASRRATRQRSAMKLRPVLARSLRYVAVLRDADGPAQFRRREELAIEHLCWARRSMHRYVCICGGGGMC